MTGGTWTLTTSLAYTGVKFPPGAISRIAMSNAEEIEQALTFGTGSGLASIIAGVEHSIPAGTAETINLFDGTLLDIYGDPARYRTLRSYAFWCSGGGDSSGLTIAGGASNPHTLFFGGTTPSKTVYPNAPADCGGSDAGVVVSSSACNVKVTNNGAVSATYVLLFAGTANSPGSATGMLMPPTYP